jgi:hypothetical protein
MDSRIDLFARFGGIRPMARKIGAKAPAVHNWKKQRRVPAAWQPHILRRAGELGLDVTAEDVMFPFPEDRQAL